MIILIILYFTNLYNLSFSLRFLHTLCPSFGSTLTVFCAHQTYQQHIFLFLLYYCYCFTLFTTLNNATSWFIQCNHIQIFPTRL